jgi:hypothetical protein
VAQVQVTIENVPQNPGDAFTVSGNTITFTSAPPSGTNNIYVYYTSPITQVIQPGQGTVFPTTLSTGGPYWDTSGNLGIGTASPDTVSGYRVLALNNTTGGIVYIKSNGTNVTQLTGDSTGSTLYTLGSQDLLLGTNNTERGRFDTVGNFRFNSGYGSVATAYGCRAWVNFNGTGTVAIRGSGNVSSITDNNTGDYTINFTNAMPDANYAIQAIGDRADGVRTATANISNAVPPTTSSCRLLMFDGTTAKDFVYITASVFR